jgi:hypothetical protein
MRDSTLLSPGLLSQGYNLRRIAAAAISSVEIVAARTPGGKTQQAAVLSAFFTNCATQLTTLIDAVLPTLSTAAAATATTLNLNFSETMDQTVLPPLSAFSSAGNTVTAVAWANATRLQLTGTGFAAADNITYVVPGVNFVRDLSGNALAGFSVAMT